MTLLPEKTDGDFIHDGYDPFVIFLGLIPGIGIGASVGSFIYATENWDENRFNLARRSAIHGYIVLGIQLVYLLLLAVFLL